MLGTGVAQASDEEAGGGERGFLLPALGQPEVDEAQVRKVAGAASEEEALGCQLADVAAVLVQEAQRLGGLA